MALRAALQPDGDEQPSAAGPQVGHAQRVVHGLLVRASVDLRRGARPALRRGLAADLIERGVEQPVRMQLHRHSGGHDGGERGERDPGDHVGNIRKVPARIVLFVAALLISGFTLRRGIEYFDEGLTLQAARRVADGQIPYDDFLWAYGPAHPYLLGGLFEAFGTSLLWWRLIRVLVDALVALAVFAILRRRVSPRWALAGALTAALAMAQPTGANPFAPALLFALLALALASGPPGARRWLAAGALAAVAAAWRLDFGVYAALAAMAAAAAAARRSDADAGGSRRLAMRAAATVGGMAVLLTLLVYTPFIAALGPADAWDELVGHSLREGSYWRLPFPFEYDGRFELWPPGDLARDAKDLLGFYVPLLLVVGLALAAATAAAARLRVSAEAVGAAVLGACFLAYLLSRADEFHATPLLVVLALLVPLLVRAAPRPLAAGLLVVLALLFSYGALNRLSALLSPPELDAVDIAVADGVRAAPDEARSIEAMVAAVQRRVRDADPIYSVTRRSDLVRINNPLVYVLAERPNPTRQDFGLQTSAAAQDEIVAALERARPQAIVRWLDPITTVRESNRRGRPTGVRTLDRWLDENFRVAERSGDYEVLVPR